MKYTFTAKSHRNILATHKNTLEFTKDKELSLDGDCILGVEADFSLKALQEMVKAHQRMRIRITAGGVSDELDFTANKTFSSERELVLRFSEFSSDRTFGFRASKSAAQLDRKLAEKLGEPQQRITVEITPYTKAVIFDFDDTLADFKISREQAHAKLAQIMAEKHGIFEPTTLKLLDEIDREFSLRGVGGKPDMYDRHLWFERFFRTVGIAATKEDIDGAVKAYWDLVTDAARPMPNAAQVLQELKKEYKLAIMTDSDGEVEVKLRRVKKTGILDLVDLFLTSDEFGQNKPNEAFYAKILSEFGAKADECVMVGDKPQVDLQLAKRLGMKTVWMKHGRWSERQTGKKFDFVDFEITDLHQLLDVMRQI